MGKLKPVLLILAVVVGYDLVGKGLVEKVKSKVSGG